eukprot:COSAG02_NODE_999_length_15328_cov_8.086360_12_plen_53_part_00
MIREGRTDRGREGGAHEESGWVGRMDEKDVQLQELRELNAELEDEIEVGARQ